MKNTKTSFLRICILLLCLCCSCGQKKQPESTQAPASQEQSGTSEGTAPQPEATPAVYAPDSFDAEGIAILVERNTTEKKVVLYDPEKAENYTLEVVGTSTFSDKYGEPLALNQIMPGDVVEVTYLKQINRLNTMHLVADGWVTKDVKKFSLDWEAQQAVIGKDKYKLSEKVLIFSDGKQITPMEINEVDILSFQGVGSSIYSIVVEKGHGYLRLKNDEDFIGGFIEVGQSKIAKITQDMLLTVPEGDYQVVISYNGGGGTRQVTIGRNQEVSLDIGDLEVAQIQYGNVLFSTDLDEVSIYVDGKQVSSLLPVSLQYGIHQVIAKADGYETMTGYFKVDRATQNVDLVLEKIEKEEKEKEEKDYQVYIDKPEGVEVYLDGNYVGIAPVSFKKEAGSHTIILRKNGYDTRSYTISLDKEEEDASFTFADMVPSVTQEKSDTVSEETTELTSEQELKEPLPPSDKKE